MITYSGLGKHGRLGNSMFQYAFVKALSLRHNHPLILPDNGAEIYSLFNLPDPKESVNRVTHRHSEAEIPYGDHFNVLMKTASKHNIIDFVGYFQDERYFSDFADTIRNIFTFKQELSDKATSIIATSKRPVCALHVRRTDYFETKGALPVQSIDYYNKAMAHFPDHTFLVVSDDIAWCRTAFVGERFLFPEERSTSLDLCLISKAAGAIIANSSFSWWGAWLGNTDKVVAPIKWFGPNTPYYAHWRIAPDRWIHE